MYRLIKRDGPGWGLRCHPLGGYSALSGDATPEGPRVSGQCPWCPQEGRLRCRHQLTATLELAAFVLVALFASLAAFHRAPEGSRPAHPHEARSGQLTASRSRSAPLC